MVRGAKETSVTEYGKDCPETESCWDFCPVDWVTEGKNCFFWNQDSFFEATTWEDAENHCRKFDAHLVSVTTSDVFEYLRSKISKDVWIGATNQTENGTWTWTDCSSFNSESPSQGKESCAHLTADGHGSNDKKCIDKLMFVCRKALCPGNSGRIENVYLYDAFPYQ